MLGGGRDREELLGYDPEAYNESDDPNRALGCHKGIYAGLNIVGADPDFIYAWAESSPRGIMLARHGGYRTVGKDEPGHANYENMPGHEHQEMDSSSSGYPGVVLVRRSVKDERKIRDEEQVQRSKLLRGGHAEQTYKAGASAQEVRFGGERFVRDNHRTHTTVGTDPDEPAVDAWTPNRG